VFGGLKDDLFKSIIRSVNEMVTMIKVSRVSAKAVRGCLVYELVRSEDGVQSDKTVVYFSPLEHSVHRSLDRRIQLRFYS
jgi:hypothetical protein